MSAKSTFMSYIGQFSGGVRCSSSYADPLVHSCEVLDLETRTIIFGGNLQSPSSFLQMVTVGQGDFLATFAYPGPVKKEDMVQGETLEKIFEIQFELLEPLGVLKTHESFQF